MPEQTELIEHRKIRTDPAAVLFIHGFSGDLAKTWGQLPALLIAKKRLRTWDVYSLGCETGVGLDILGVRRAKQDLDALALITKSTGGLVVPAFEGASTTSFCLARPPKARSPASCVRIGQKSSPKSCPSFSAPRRI
jgi:hypothetical protein